MRYCHVVFAFTTMILTSCFSGNKSIAPVVFHNCGDTVHTHVNDTFSVRLRSAVATGFRWELKDSTSIAILKVSNPPPVVSEDPSRDGGYGNQWFRFKAIKPGSGYIAFKYRRVFGGSTKADDSCRVFVNVQ